MKKKKGFTLAEVLITLAIIGVVAAMSIPALMKNIEEADNKTRLKKIYSTLSQATKQMFYENGGTLKGFGSSSAYISVLSKYLNITKSCTRDELYGNCWQPLGQYYNHAGYPISTWGKEAGVILNDGQFVFTGYNSSTCSITETGVNICAEYYVDVNGFKAPNKQGYDIFRFHIFENGQVMPNGYQGDLMHIKDCRQLSYSGFECTAKFLLE